MVSGSTPDEIFRAALPARTPADEPATLIITRQGLGRAARVWLTFNGAMKTTAVLTDSETAQLAELMTKAMAGSRPARRCRRGPLRDRSGYGSPRLRQAQQKADAGQWGWIAEETDMPIAEAIADELVRAA